MATNLDGARWRKSSYSGPNGGECVEVAHVEGVIAVRDSKNSAGPLLIFRGDPRVLKLIRD
jgi:hypothetical protein